jgi:hypothetical protein
MRYPLMPKTIGAPGGPIKVRLVKREKTSDGDPAWGSWEPHTRTIRIERGAPVAHRWRTFYHEVTHAWMDDNGISEILSPQGEEAMCKAVASGLMAMGVFPPKG